MAQAATGKTGIIATDNTYHGNTTAVSQLSRRMPIGGYAPHVRHVPAPNSLHPVGGSLDGQAQAFADHISVAIAELEVAGFGFSGMILCPTFVNEGFPSLPPGFLDPAVAVIRAAGGLVICDEVQPGFGRIGADFWGHDYIGLVPDVVTLGKPMANGHPVAAVMTRPDVMATFREAFGYFNTFGGNPVSTAAASAMLDVLESEDLVTNARKVGTHCLTRLEAMTHPLKEQARGQGLIFGIEFEADGAPATEFVAKVVEHMKRGGVLMGRNGRQMNILKMRPPMPFSIENGDFVMDLLEDALRVVPYD
jgi:4-aminobutyrate aminotransferase-like enzyme